MKKMKLRFKVVTFDYPSNHPQFPNERHWRIKDLKDNTLGLASYSTKERADAVAAQKNGITQKV